MRAGIVAAALEELFGSARDTADAALAKWDDGVPVELFEAPSGPPFVVLGGKRHTVRASRYPIPSATSKHRSSPKVTM